MPFWTEHGAVIRHALMSYLDVQPMKWGLRSLGHVSCHGVFPDLSSEYSTSSPANRGQCTTRPVAQSANSAHVGAFGRQPSPDVRTDNSDDFRRWPSRDSSICLFRRRNTQPRPHVLFHPTSTNTDSAGSHARRCRG
ncbi:hypothetical protein SCLCIDRAFT_736024 [Scleroderma citrinum Foug A]|uniref:Uncharacterized protein n=1 Tax=Scleroderma citrinum Foug A TaxID=1036808 RepID=A0A0C3E5F9_9AGAM|nr:hypothetical protein SCLCIDRAFT_736024 [Scleroderma citrinum Foug A]